MRRVRRSELSPSAQVALAGYTRQVMSDTNPKARASALWGTKDKRTFDEVRERLVAMASGRARCMYCEDSFGADIEHFRPKSSHPDHAFDWFNYLLACSHCNSNLKRTEFPVDRSGDPLLLDPSADAPADHLIFIPHTGEFEAIGAKGPESIRVFGLNDDTGPRKLPRGRRQALISLIALLKEYDREVDGHPARAREIEDTVKDFPFSAVLHWMIGVAQTSPSVLGGDVVALLRVHGVASWI